MVNKVPSDEEQNPGKQLQKQESSAYKAYEDHWRITTTKLGAPWLLWAILPPNILYGSDNQPDGG